ncbi:PAS domain-containing sensor histidine kinase [Paenibacillus sp. MY03]|jgi:two-component system phosphate regulon sensor histidine kinase PhoR|uniref:two-component system histidine kinase PnpS n=1 Tax=Paenibacillus sp. MY03 TaxID=302980 RepID=UPI000B3CFC88|nr:ATP-binding protein [Paenibacillus sp. MY03]OUS70052.1 PAS domain-containing sensor histidine kinase [Paenibacillus sp. MY03]
MNSFRTRLTIIIIAMTALSVTAAGFLMMKTFKNNHINALEDNMVRELHLIVNKMDWLTGELEEQSFYYTKEAEELKGYTDARVTFMRGDGTVIGDSDYDPRTMDNHASRKEVMEAMDKGIGQAVRPSETAGESLIYVAIPHVVVEDGNTYIIRLAMSLQEVEGSIDQLTIVLIGGLWVLCIVAAVISYRIALSLTKPLEQITKVAKRIKNMDYRARVKTTKQDEIGELGTAINAMADSLQVQMSRIRQNENQLESVLANMINGVVMIDVHGIILLMNRRAEEVLGFSARELVGRHFAEAKQQYELAQIIQEALDSREHLREEITFYFPEERLLELNLVPVRENNDGEFSGVLLVLQDVSAIRRLERMRSEFVANVSHELKTPIAAVKGFAETLLGGAVKDEETARSFLQIIFDESERLNRLIGDILELSKIESRRVPLMFSPVEMDGFIDKTVKLLEPEAKRRGIALERDVESGLYLEADEDRLRQIMMNLLSNGINYTPEGGHVTIRIYAYGDEQVRIQIRDSGIGIPKKDLPRVFERFYRVDKARSRSSGGTGLGLSIVKHLVELHKGTISVSSTVGVGTTFTIDLPVIQ